MIRNLNYYMGSNDYMFRKTNTDHFKWHVGHCNVIEIYTLNTSTSIAKLKREIFLKNYSFGSKRYANLYVRTSPLYVQTKVRSI
jgi:hypothetical protein